MRQKRYGTYLIVISSIVLFCSSAVNPIFGTAAHTEEYLLPPPLQVDTILEHTLFQRMSIREFTNETVSDEQLSTVLWAACGYQSSGGRTISSINGTYANIIYVLKEDAAYTYNPMNHSLVFFKSGDWRDIVGWQYEAPIQLCLCWDTIKADANLAGAELGEIGQNIQFMANALNLGTVVCGQTPPAIDPLKIPENEEGMIIMPLGYPLHPYNFKDRPLWFSLLPRIQTSMMSLSTALDTHSDGTSFSGTVTKKEISQMIWSTYGFSPYLDKSNQDLNAIKRHRTVPSAHGYYPFHIYAVTEKGIYRYEPNLLMMFNKMVNISAPVDFLGLPILTYLSKVSSGDYRSDIADASAQPGITTAPLIIIPVLDLNLTRSEGLDDLSSEQARRFWYYEAGASAQNVLLEATAWNLSADIILPTDSFAIQSLLNLDENNLPLLILPIGKQVSLS